MILTFTTSFNLADKKVRITDTTNYSGVTTPPIYGNVTARIGNTIFYQNTNFDASADIVIGTNSYVEFDLPLNADGTVRQTTYSFTYEVKIFDQLLQASDVITPEEAVFNNIVISPSSSVIINSIAAAIAGGQICRLYFNTFNFPEGVVITSTTGNNTINFDTIFSEDWFDITYIEVRTASTSSLTNIYDFCDKSPKADLCVTSDCYFATLEAIDSTAYLATQTIVDRVLTINWPRLANGNAVQPPTVTDQASQVVGPNLYTGDFLVTLSTDIISTQIDGLIVTNTIAARSDFNVNCDGGICEAYSCIKAYAVQYQEAVAQGSRQIAQFQQQNFQILIYCNLYNLAVECQHTTEARAILVALSEYMNTNGVTAMGCSCGCGNAANNSTEPTVIYPLYNTATYNDATELARGIIQLATQAETNAGLDDTKAITPLKLANYIGFFIPIASQTVAGIIEIATQLETNSGLDNTKAITPLTLSENITTRIAGQATAESAATVSPVTSINNVSLLTARGWRYAWDKALTLAWSFAEKISFSKGINVVSSTNPLSDGDITFNSNRYNGKIGGGVVSFITSDSAATESVQGIAEIANQVESEAAASAAIGSINNTKIVTPKGWRWAWEKAITLAWNITGKFNFISGVNLASSVVPSSNGDMVYFSDSFYGQADGSFVQFITSANTATESTKGIAELATQAEVATGTDDTRFVTPLKLRQNQFNTASATAFIGTPYTVTLNSIAGNIIIPAGIGCNIVSGTAQIITLNNNKITTTSIIEYTVRGYGKALLQGGYNVTTNQAQISLFNGDVSNVLQLDIYFKILNP
jgi:hypothetical protein